jgi:hypothetical protein
VATERSAQLLSETAEQARRIFDLLCRQHAELAKADAVDPLVRDQGLIAMADAMASARRLADHPAVAGQQQRPGLPSSMTDFPGD